MFISVGQDGKLTLREPDDFKRLHAEAAEAGMSREAVAAALATIATVEDGNAWVGVEALRQLSGRAGDPAWSSSFDSMIRSVQKFGWVSPDGARVRCHIK